jgi:asparagine synthase (glutamine-hydrolysing)
VRCPLLDHRVVELAWSLPLEMRLGDGGKRVLRRLLDRYVPPALSDRPKAGFSVPIADWLRGPLRDWGESLLDEGRLRRAGFLDPAAVRRIWRQHQLGWLSHDQLLWNVLMFQAWLDAR